MPVHHAAICQASALDCFEAADQHSRQKIPWLYIAAEQASALECINVCIGIAAADYSRKESRRSTWLQLRELLCRHVQGSISQSRRVAKSAARHVQS